MASLELADLLYCFTICHRNDQQIRAAGAARRCYLLSPPKLPSSGMLLLFEVQPTRSTRVAHNQRWFAFSRCKGAFYLATRNKTQLQSSGLQQTMQGLPTLRVGAQRRGLQPPSRRWRGRQGLNLPAVYYRVEGLTTTPAWEANSSLRRQRCHPLPL